MFFSLSLIGIFVLLEICSSSIDYTQDFTFVCENSQYINGKDLFCDMVKWRSARMYEKDSFRIYGDNVPIAVSDQDGYGSYLNDQYRTKNYGDSCTAMIKHLSCVEAFPVCSFNGEHTNSPSYFPPCKLQCELVNRNCPFTLDCSGLHDENCHLYISVNYFALPPNVGNVTAFWELYAVLLAIWLCMSIVWYTLLYVNDKECLLVCRAVANVIPLKTLVVCICFIMWYTCDQWLVCSVWLHTAAINLHLVYMSAEMFLFCLIGSGLGVVTPHVISNDWRAIIGILFAFYIGNSVLLVMKNASLTLYEFWIGSGVLYFICYSFIYFIASNTTNLFIEQGRKINPYDEDVETNLLAEDSGSDDDEVVERIPNLNRNRTVDDGEVGLFEGIYRLFYFTLPRCFMHMKWLLGFDYGENSMNLNKKMKYQIYLRRDMYVAFLVLVTINVAMEIYTHSIEAEKDHTFYMIILAFELSNLFTVGMIFFVFAPRKVNPFFFAMPLYTVAPRDPTLGATDEILPLNVVGESGRTMTLVNTMQNSVHGHNFHLWLDPVTRPSNADDNNNSTTTSTFGVSTVKVLEGFSSNGEPIGLPTDVCVTPLLFSNLRRAPVEEQLNARRQPSAHTEAGTEGVEMSSMVSNSERNGSKSTVMSVIRYPANQLFVGFAPEPKK